LDDPVTPTPSEATSRQQRETGLAFSLAGAAMGKREGVRLAAPAARQPTAAPARCATIPARSSVDVTSS